MPGLDAQTLAGFLDEVAAPTPAPGGGSSAGCTAALAAALVEMAARLAIERHGPEGLSADLPERARALRRKALELAEQELSTYGAVLDAVRLPADDPRRADRLEEALVEASRPPVEIAQAAAVVAELGLAVARASSPSVRGDALTGTLLAESASAAAATLVQINLAQRPSDGLRNQASEARARAGRAREAAERID